MKKARIVEQRRALVVDDEACIRTVIKTILKRQGYEVIEAENGLEALQLAPFSPCGLVVTDQIMPLLSGLDLIAGSRRSVTRPATS